MLRPPKWHIETVATLAATAFAAILLVVTAMYAGPLWRDEANTINVAQMPTLKELWHNMSFESFPPLWPLILRGCDFLGLANGDAGIRVLGLFVGFLFFASLWLCSRWLGGHAPIMSIALLGSLPAFIFIIGANRAYGLASCLLVFSFGMIWRMIESPSKSRALGTGLVCMLFTQCVYYDAFFLCAMLSGAALVVIRRRQWKTLGALVAIGAVAGSSMLIYLPVIHSGSAYVPMNQDPSFNFSVLWNKLGNAVAARSNARPPSADHTALWLWVILLCVGVAAALMMQWKRHRPMPAQDAVATGVVHDRSDLTLYCAVTMLFGVVSFMGFLMTLQYGTQSWYYVEMLCLCAICLDGLLGASCPALRPWGFLRIAFMVVIMTWSASSAWDEARSRRSNVDLIAAALEQNAAKGDLIVVQSAWEGITFDRYYHGHARWVTVPPIESHKVHRNDLAFESMNQPDPMAPVLVAITNTLREGNRVWLVGSSLPKLAATSSPVKNFATYYNFWSGQIAAQLSGHAQQLQIVEIPAGGPVNRLENLPVMQFSGYKPVAN